MNSVGQHQPKYARVLFVIFAIISAFAFGIQMLFLRKMRILPVFLLPIVSFCICFENSVLYQGDSITNHSDAANAGYLFHSLIFPLFIIILYETTLRLHEVRCAHFWCIPFDQGPAITHIPSMVSIWVVRLVAAGLFIMNIFSTFSLLENSNALAGQGGYDTLKDQPHSVHLWISLVPSIVLGVVGLMMDIAIYRLVLIYF